MHLLCCADPGEKQSTLDTRYINLTGMDVSDDRKRLILEKLMWQDL